MVHIDLKEASFPDILFQCSPETFTGGTGHLSAFLALGKQGKATVGAAGPSPSGFSDSQTTRFRKQMMFWAVKDSCRRFPQTLLLFPGCSENTAHKRRLAPSSEQRARFLSIYLPPRSSSHGLVNAGSLFASQGHICLATQLED